MPDAPTTRCFPATAQYDDRSDQLPLGQRGPRAGALTQDACVTSPPCSTSAGTGATLQASTHDLTELKTLIDRALRTRS